VSAYSIVQQSKTRLRTYAVDLYRPTIRHSTTSRPQHRSKNTRAEAARCSAYRMVRVHGMFLLEYYSWCSLVTGVLLPLPQYVPVYIVPLLVFVFVCGKKRVGVDFSSKKIEQVNAFHFSRHGDNSGPQVGEAPLWRPGVFNSTCILINPSTRFCELFVFRLITYVNHLHATAAPTVMPTQAVILSNSETSIASKTIRPLDVIAQLAQLRTYHALLELLIDRLV